MPITEQFIKLTKGNISKNTYFEGYLRKAATKMVLGIDCLGLSFWTVAFKTEL